MCEDVIKLKRVHIGAVVGLAAVAALIAPTTASAEGMFSSNLQHVRTDFHSRNWTKNLSGDRTTQVSFTNCVTTAPEKSTVIRLFKAIDFFPDTNLGDRTFLNCFSGGATGLHDWGAQGTGNYYFDVAKIGGLSDEPDYELGVSSLRVYY